MVAIPVTPRSRHRRHSRTLCLLAMAVVLLSLISPPAASQGQSRLQIESLGPNTSLVVDEPNRVTVQIRNAGSAPNGATVALAYEGCGTPPEDGAINSAVIPSIQPGETARQDFTWTGRSASDGTPGSTGHPLPGNCFLRATLQPLIQETDTTNHSKKLGISLKQYKPALRLDEPLDASPGGTAEQAFYVQNQGTVEDLIRLTLDKPTDGWEFILSTTEVRLQAGEETPAIKVYATVPANANRGDSGTAQIVATSGGRAASIASAALGPFEALTRAGVTLAVAPNSPLMEPGAVETVPVQVTNVGNDDATIDLTVTANFPIVNALLTPTPITVSRGTTGTADLDLEVDHAAQAGSATVTVRAVVRDHPHVFAEAVHTVHVAQRYGVDARRPTGTPANNPVVAPPGQETEFVVVLANLGNGPDNVTLSLPSIPTGWTSRLPQTVWTLLAGATADAHVFVRPPDAQPPSTLTLTAKAVSEGSPAHHATRTIPVSVPTHRGADFAAADEKILLPSAGPAQATFHVTNHGNVDDVFTVAASFEEATPPTGWSATIEPPSVSLAPGASAAVTVIVDAPADREGATAQLRILLGAQGDPDFQRTATTRFVGRLANLEVLSVAVTPSTPYQGDTLYVNASIVNTGTRPVTSPFDMQILVQNDLDSTTLLSFTQRVPSLGNGPEDSANISASTSTAGKTGSYTVRVIADAAPGGEVAEETKQDNEITQTITIHDARISVLAPEPPSIRPAESRLLEGAKTFRVKNDGAFPEEVRVTVSSAHPWFTVPGPATLTLAPGEIRAVPIMINMPGRPGDPSTPVSFNATLTNTIRTPASNQTNVLVNATLAPVIEAVNAEPPVTIIGGQVRFTATILSAVRLREAKLHLTEPDGVLKILDLQAGSPSDASWSLEVALTKPGTYAYSVRAMDDSTNANRAVPLTSQRSVSVRSNSTPEIRLVSPVEGAALKEQQAIIFHVTDVLPLRRIWSVTPEANRSVPVGNPVRVHVSNWPEGEAQVTVYAENAAAGSSNRTFRFLVDHTPPTIGLLETRVSPNGPRVHLNVPIGHADVASVTAALRFQKGDPVVIPLSLGENGTYAAELNISSALHAVTVTATDQAGNSAHREFPMIRPLETTHSTPGPGLLAILAAIAGIGWHTRTRRASAGPKKPVALPLLLIFLIPILGVASLGGANAQACPTDPPIIMDANTIITNTYTVNCQRILLSADLTIAAGGRMELGQSVVELRGANPVTIQVQAQGTLVLHHWTQFSPAPGSSVEYVLRVAPGGVLVVIDSSILNAKEVTLRSDGVTLRRSTFEPAASHIGLTVDGATITATEIGIRGGAIGLVLAGGAHVRIESSRITGQTEAGIQLLDGTRLTIDAGVVSGATNGVIAIGASHLTARNSTLSGLTKTFVALDTSGRGPSAQLEGTPIAASQMQITESTLVEQYWFASTVTQWSATAPPASSVGSPVPDARVEIRNESAAILGQFAADAQGRTPALAVKSTTWQGAHSIEHGPFRFLVRSGHSAVSSNVPVTSDRTGAQAIPIGLAYDDDLEAPGWNGDEPILVAPQYSRGSVALTWRPATDHPSPEHPNREVAGYEVFRVRETAPAQRAGFATTNSFTDTGLADGRYHYRIRPVDLAGNSGSESPFAQTLVDQTPPNLHLEYNRSASLHPGNFSGPVRVDAAAADLGSGMATLRYRVGTTVSQQPPQITEPGFYVIRAEAEDNAGNVVIQYANVTLDQVPPSLRMRLVPNQPDGLDGWYRIPPLLNLTATDEGPARVAHIHYRWGTDPWQSYSTDAPLTGNGARDLHASARDSAGNEALLSRVVKIDSEPPLVQVLVPAPDGENGWFRTAPRVSCDASDAASGVQRRQIRTTQTDWRDIAASTEIQHEGNTLVECRATDGAGNTRESSPVSIRIDTQNPIPPVVVLVADPDRPDKVVADWSRNPPLDAASGLWKTRILRAIDNGPFEVVAELAPTVTSTPIVRPSTGNATYAVEVVDRAGHPARSNFAAASERGIKLLATPKTDAVRPISGMAVLRADPPTGFEAAEAEFYWDGVLVNATATPPFDYKLDSRSVRDGLHEARIVLVSSSGVSYEETITVDVRNGYGAVLQDQGPILGASVVTLVLNVIVGLVGVRRWLTR